MNNLNALKDKEPKEVARLLSVVSSTLLPNPGIAEVIHKTGSDPEFVKAVLAEIRNYLRVPESDRSIQTQSRIFAFLSQEISRAALANANMSSLKARLGNKGALHPSQYEVRFTDYFDRCEALGTRKSHVIEAVTKPDKVMNPRPKYLSEDNDPRVTVSIRFVGSKKVEDRFSLIVTSSRDGQCQTVGAAFRAYLSDVDLTNINEPLDMVRSFVNTYGLTFRLGNKVSKFMHNEIISSDSPLSRERLKNIEMLDKPKEDLVWPVFAFNITQVRGTDNEILTEVILGFVLNVSKYVATLRKHHVHLSSEAEEKFRHI